MARFLSRSLTAAAWAAPGAAWWLPLRIVIAVTGLSVAATITAAVRGRDRHDMDLLLGALLANRPHAREQKPDLRTVR
jgi:hypothetical protein